MRGLTESGSEDEHIEGDCRGQSLIDEGAQICPITPRKRHKFGEQQTNNYIFPRQLWEHRRSTRVHQKLRHVLKRERHDP